jgi:hypothetical protein
MPNFQAIPASGAISFFDFTAIMSGLPIDVDDGRMRVMNESSSGQQISLSSCYSAGIDWQYNINTYWVRCNTPVTTVWAYLWDSGWVTGGMARDTPWPFWADGYRYFLGGVAKVQDGQSFYYIGRRSW